MWVASRTTARGAWTASVRAVSRVYNADMRRCPNESGLATQCRWSSLKDKTKTLLKAVDAFKIDDKNRTSDSQPSRQRNLQDFTERLRKSPAIHKMMAADFDRFAQVTMRTIIMMQRGPRSPFLHHDVFTLHCAVHPGC